MLAAIEVYNKPDFKYREETFAILALNAWELLLKAKWLKDRDNKLRSLYVLERKRRASGKPYQRKTIKLTACGNPFTHSVEYLVNRLRESGTLATAAAKNVVALAEVRDSSVHFYNRSNLFAVRLQEIGSAAVRNFAKALQSWFEIDLSKYNFYLMPIAFVTPTRRITAILLSKEEKNFAEFISSLEAANDDPSDFAVSVNVELAFSRSKADDALKVQLSNEPDAIKVQLTEEQLKDRYPLTYEKLTLECNERYSDFLINRKYHSIRQPLKSDRKFCLVRRLDPDNPRSARQEWYSRSILSELDKHYTKR